MQMGAHDISWDQKSPQGYLEICAILQKYIDQGISVNTSYNPENYEDQKVPMSVMIEDLVTAYKYALKQLYYINTYDGAGEHTEQQELPPIEFYGEFAEEVEEDCEACVI